MILWTFFALFESSSVAAPLDANLLYFVLVDRFYNGDSSNDGETAPKDLQAFHGGDLTGLTQKLDYLQSLGVDTIWTSPIFTMRTEKFHGYGAFHGYWITHLDSIEPRFGGDQALQVLAKETKNREMNLILDMVYNHVSFDSPMRDAHPDWFHPYPSITDWNDPFQLTHHSVHGLPDLNQNRPPVYNYLLHRSLYWKEQTDIAGYRIDAIRHIHPEFTAKISADLHQKTDLWLLGEDFQGNPSALIERAQHSGLDALFDFPMYYALTESFCDSKGAAPVASILSMDTYYPEKFQLVRFLDNHDVPRIVTRCNEDVSKARQALFFIFSVRGIPMLTYGTEGWLNGDHEPENRKDMPWESLTEEEMIKTLSSLRKQHPVLRDGTGQILEYSADRLVYQQFHNNEVAVYIHNWSNTEYIPQIPPYIGQIDERWLLTDQLRRTTDNRVPSGASMLLIAAAKIPESKPVTLTVSVLGDASEPLLLVGNLPEVGGWKPEQGAVFSHDGTHWTTNVTIPQGSVLSCKLVRKTESSYQWEDGENHILWGDKNKPILLNSRL